MGRKHKIIESSNSEYWIELCPIPASAYFSFNMLRQGDEKNSKFVPEDWYTVTFEGTICSRSAKIEMGTPIAVELREVDGEHSAGGYLRCRKGRKAELYFRIKKECFFTMCNYIKDGTVKYIRAFGKVLFRGSAAIYSIDFSSHMDDE